jgi:LemA protein
MRKTTYIVIAVVVLILIYAWSVYNGLVTGTVAIDNQWAQVETQYQRRFDLIPNLVESVKGIFNQEKAVFNALAEARARYANVSGKTTTTDVDAKVRAAGEVETALSRLLVIMENYPQLKSSDTVQTLMSQLEGTENRVSVERKRFNDAVANYNLKTKRFPSSIVASLFGFVERAYFEAAAGSENAPKVQF